MVAFANTVFHRSGANTLSTMRRALTVEFSTEPILNPDTGAEQIWAIPFLENGMVCAG
jgi:hypothetical protein